MAEPRRALGVWLTLIFALVLVGWMPTTASAKPDPPRLSIGIDNGRTSVDAGDKLTYTTTVTNLGGDKVTDLRVTQTLPSGSNLVAAGSDGAIHRGSVSWKVTVGATKTVSLHSTIAVAADTPPELLRLATVACAATSRKGPPIVCASDSDELPAGARAEADQAAAQLPAETGGATWRLVAGSLFALAAIAVTLTVVVRRRRSRP